MMPGGVQLENIVLASDDPQRASRFYSTVLLADLRLVKSGPVEFYVGTVGGVGLQIVAKSFARIQAKENVHQLRFSVADIDACAKCALEADGSIVDEGVAADGRRILCLRDPDGNSLEL